MIKQKLKDIQEGRLTAEENITKFIEKIKKENDKLNVVLHVNVRALEQAKSVDEKIKSGKAGRLAGLGFLVKSNINVDGFICNCGSRTLENYKSGFNATAVGNLLNEDAVFLGMVNMDEFACGASGETSAFGCCKNPAVLSRIPGGSSSGSAAAVAAGFCDFALGSDTGGSIRNPASHCGVVGFKPSYGSVSRYGLIDMCMSFDQIGPLAKKVEDCSLVFQTIKCKDENDASSRDFKNSKKDTKKLRIGILDINADSRIFNLIRSKVEKISLEKKWSAENISLNHVDLGIQTYYPIVYTEFFSGTRKFDGRKYGHKIEEVCGEEVLRRILGGQEITKAEYGGQYYRRALKSKKIIENEFEEAFKRVDVIIMPTVPKLPHKIGSKISVEEMYDYDVCTVLANLAEIPGISVPCGFIEDEGEEVPVGIQILASRGDDDFLLDVGREFEK